MRLIFILLSALMIAGCASSRTSLTNPEGQKHTELENDDVSTRLASFRCLYFKDQNPLTEEHIEYIREQSENGDFLCKTILGEMYEYGLGMPKDVATAKAIYQAAADIDEAAYSKLGRMAEEGIGEPVNYVKARQFYERGAAAGNPWGAVQLAKLMEEGKGGPQDLNGALALYLNVIEGYRYRDDALNGIQRLRAEGLVLNADQKKQYNESWLRGMRSRLRGKIDYTQRQLSRDIEPGPTIRPARLQLKFSVGSDVPEVSILESSNDPAIDQAILQAMSTYRILNEPILPENQKTWLVVIPDFSLDSK